VLSVECKVQAAGPLPHTPKLKLTTPTTNSSSNSSNSNTKTTVKHPSTSHLQGWIAANLSRQTAAQHSLARSNCPATLAFT